MERRGRIPVATFRTADGKTRSKSRVRDANSNESSEMDFFTLLEENIALKDENQEMKATIAKQSDNVKLLEEEKLQLRMQIKDLNEKREKSRAQLNELNLASLQAMQNHTTNNKNVDNNLNKNNISSNNRETYSINEFESLIEICEDKSDAAPFGCIQKLLTEFSNLKTNLNTLELQLYEANEKIAELLENQNQLEKDNSTLQEMCLLSTLGRTERFEYTSKANNQHKETENLTFDSNENNLIDFSHEIDPVGVLETNNVVEPCIIEKNNAIEISTKESTTTSDRIVEMGYIRKASGDVWYRIPLYDSNSATSDRKDNVKK